MRNDEQVQVNDERNKIKDRIENVVANDGRVYIFPELRSPENIPDAEIFFYEDGMQLGVKDVDKYLYKYGEDDLELREVDPLQELLIQKMLDYNESLTALMAAKVNYDIDENMIKSLINVKEYEALVKETGERDEELEIEVYSNAIECLYVSEAKNIREGKYSSVDTLKVVSMEETILDSIINENINDMAV